MFWESASWNLNDSHQTPQQLIHREHAAPGPDHLAVSWHSEVNCDPEKDILVHKLLGAKNGLRLRGTNDASHELEKMGSISPLRQLLRQAEQHVLDFEETGDDDAYNQSLKTLRRLFLEVEKPGDHAMRIRFQPLQNTALIMLAHLGVIQYIASNKDRTVTATEAAEACSCNEELLVRLMRLLTSVDIFEEVSFRAYRSTPHGEVLASVGQVAGLRYIMELHGKSGAHIWEYLDSREASNDATGMSPLQYAHGGRTLWELFDASPELRKTFNDYMDSARRGGGTQMFTERWPPGKQLTKEKLRTEKDAVLMVDVGGGKGTQVRKFREEFKNLPGRCILEDLQPTVEKVGDDLEKEGVEKLAYDFFEKQPIEGAKLYLFRNVMHDWPDEECIKILENTISVMDPEYSRLLIDEWVVPDVGASLRAAEMDINMYLSFEAKERTQGQWKKLLDRVGLEIVEIYHTPGSGESVIETRMKK